MSTPFDLITFDPGDEAHQAFVYGTFRKSTDHWPWSELPRQRLVDRLRRELARPGTETRIATPYGMPDSYLGWYAARRPGVIVYAYTRYSARRQGVATAALEQLGVVFQVRTVAADAQPMSVGLTFWTAAAARITRASRPLFFDTREAFDDAR